MIYLKISLALLTPVILATAFFFAITFDFFPILSICFLIIVALGIYSVVFFGDRIVEANPWHLSIAGFIGFIGWGVAFFVTVSFVFILGYALPDEGRNTPEWLLSLVVMAPICIVAAFTAFVAGLFVKPVQEKIS